MSKGYENFAKLLAERGLSSYKVAKGAGISNSFLSEWKTGRSVPKQDKMKLIADYLGVTTDYLYGIDEIKESINNTLNEQIDGIDFALSGEIRKLSDAEKQDILDYIRFKRQNKGG